MPPSAWTWLVYMAVDESEGGDLELKDVSEWATKSVTALAAAKRGQQVRVLVQQDRAHGASRYEIGGEAQVDLGLLDSGDPKSLVDFIAWGVKTAPATRYALVLWSHGSGWQSSYDPRQGPSARPDAERGSARRTPGFFSSTRRQLDSLAPNDRAIAGDNGTGQAIDTLELGKLMGEVSGLLKGKLDLLLMNACQMASVEVAYQLRASVGVYVATEVDMPASSLPYTRILSQLGASPAMDGDALGDLMAREYCAYQAEIREPAKWGLKNRKGQFTFPPGAAMTALRPARLTRVAGAVKALGAAIRAELSNATTGTVLWEVIDAAPLMADLRLGDLERFARMLAADKRVSPAIKQAAEGLVAAVRDPELIAARHYTSSIPSAALLKEQVGLTTFMPMPSGDSKKMISDEYNQTDYAKETAWGETLAAWHKAVS